MGEVDNGAIFQLLGTVAAEMRDMKAEMRDMKAGLGSLDHKVESLRQAVTEYHASVLGHGILISNLEDRVRRIEKHLDLPPYAAE